MKGGATSSTISRGSFAASSASAGIAASTAAAAAIINERRLNMSRPLCFELLRHVMPWARAGFFALDQAFRRPPVLVIPANEEAMIARHTLDVVCSPSTPRRPLIEEDQCAQLPTRMISHAN